MKQCGYCGRRYSEDSLKFCLDDGSALSADPEATVLSSRSSETAPEPVVPPETSDDTTQTSTPLPRRNWWYAAVLVVAALLGATLVVVYKEIRLPVTSDDADGSASATPLVSPSPLAREAETSNEPASESKSEAAPSTPLNGTWRLNNTVASSSYRPYLNLELEYRIVINQEGRAFTGKGEKVMEAGESLPASRRTSIELQGVVHPDRVEASFIEKGSRRQTSGNFVWRLESEGKRMSGSFASDAARSSGSSVAFKER